MDKLSEHHSRDPFHRYQLKAYTNAGMQPQQTFNKVTFTHTQGIEGKRIRVPHI